MPTLSPPADGPETPSAFARLGLDPRLLHNLAQLGFDEPTPIQAGVIEPLLAGRDTVGRARTGSGKTAAFGLPLLQQIHRANSGAELTQSEPGPRRAPGVQALVLAPTRELALQVTDALRSYAEGLAVRLVTVYGGAAYGPQVQALQRGVDVVVGTPGRLLDLLDKRLLSLSTVRLVVIDEADELLRMGFFEDVERLLAATPEGRQVALFSATLPDPIREVARTYLDQPVAVEVERTVLTVDHIEQRWIWAPYYHKPDALERVLRAAPDAKVLVFVRTRAASVEVAEGLAQRGFAVEALHGDLAQPARERVMRRFRSDRLHIVVATDVAARGLDVEHMTHVINFDLPDDLESYVHRIGRTGRAGRKGIAISFVTPRELRRLPEMERRLKVRIQEMEVPSDAEIAARQREELEVQLGTALGRDDIGVVRAAVGRLVEASGWSVEDLAVAGLALLADAQGVSLEAKRDARPPHWTRKRPERRPDRRRNPRPDRRADRPYREGARPRRDPADFAASNEVELFVAMGSERGLRPQDVVGVLANEKGIPGKRIGRITLLERKCFVGLTQDDADALLAETNRLSLRGTEVPIARARPQRSAERPVRHAKPDTAARHAKPAKPGAPDTPGRDDPPHKPMWNKFDKRKGHRVGAPMRRKRPKGSR